jgi:aminomethyltransferase
MDSELQGYLARRSEVLARIQRMLVVSLNLRRKPEEIDPDTALFGTGLSIDSIDAVEILVALEIEFGVKLPDPIERRRWLRSVNALVDLVLERGTLKDLPLPRMEEGPPERSEAEPKDLFPTGERAPISAIRTSCTVTRLEHVHALKLTGPGAVDLLDAAATSRLFVRENQLLQTLLLDASGRPFADAFLGLDEEAWLMLAEGPERSALLEHLAQVRRQHVPDADVGIGDLRDEHELWGVDGPFAWELVSQLLGPEVLGAPYLSFLRVRDIICLRAGKTGEYGYMLLVPRPAAAETWARLLELGGPLQLAEGDLATLDQCALENWHYSIRLAALMPDELQLRWRIDLGKRFEGAEALRARAQSGGPKQRLTCFTARAEVPLGARVELDGAQVGTVVASAWSRTRKDQVGWALLDTALACPGIAKLTSNGVGLTTMSPPLIDNRSLFVDPRKHTFRGEHAFPPLVSR